MQVIKNLHNLKSDFNPFLTNVPFIDKPGSWFLLAKCLKNTCGRVIYSVKMQVDDHHQMLSQLHNRFSEF